MEHYRYFVATGFCSVVNPSNGSKLAQSVQDGRPKSDTVSRVNKVPSYQSEQRVCHR
jgi:hypothetical protein